MWAAELYFNEIIPVLNCGCQLTPADLYDDHKMVVVNNKNWHICSVITDIKQTQPTEENMAYITYDVLTDEYKGYNFNCCNPQDCTMRTAVKKQST